MADPQNLSQEEALTNPQSSGLSVLMVQLLKGVLYRDQDAARWSLLLRLQARVREQAEILMLEMVLDEAEGYAYFKSADTQIEGEPPLPRLVARRALSYPVSLLLALLRKRLAEFDAGGGDTRLILSHAEIADLMRVFIPDQSNEVKLLGKLDGSINKVVELGFLRRLKPAAAAADASAHYEVMRIIKAFVDAQWLADLDAQLALYRRQLAGETDGDADE